MFHELLPCFKPIPGNLSIYQQQNHTRNALSYPMIFAALLWLFHFVSFDFVVVVVDLSRKSPVPGLMRLFLRVNQNGGSSQGQLQMEMESNPLSQVNWTVFPSIFSVLKMAGAGRSADVIFVIFDWMKKRTFLVIQREFIEQRWFSWLFPDLISDAEGIIPSNIWLAALATAFPGPMEATARTWSPLKITAKKLHLSTYYTLS